MASRRIAICAGLLVAAAGLAVPAQDDDPSAVPVLFVHGMGGSPADFAVLARALVQAGYHAERLQAVELPGAWGSSNVENAAALEKAAHALSAKWGRRAVVIAHSMGGLSARHLMEFLDGSRWVETLVLLGTMNLGFPPGGFSSPCSAPLGIVRYLEELCSTSGFITSLNFGARLPESASFINVFSESDEVVPRDSAWLTGAENIALRGVTHSGPGGYLEDAAVLRLVVDRMRDAHARQRYRF